MNRLELLALEETRAYRTFTWGDSEDGVARIERPEMRANQDGSSLTYFGHASVVEHEYKVYGGPPYGWNETIARGAFKRTLLNNADLAFLINHDGLTLARTKSGTLTLDEDPQGLRVMADLDPASQTVRDLQSAVDRGDVDEMSFAGRFVSSEWSDEEGQPSDAMVGTNRRVLEINLNKGDVSAVNYGANPATSGGFRELDRALAELRSGKSLNDDQRALLRSFASGIEETTIPDEVPAELLAFEKLWAARQNV